MHGTLNQGSVKWRMLHSNTVCHRNQSFFFLALKVKHDFISKIKANLHFSFWTNLNFIQISNGVLRPFWMGWPRWGTDSRKGDIELRISECPTRHNSFILLGCTYIRKRLINLVNFGCGWRGLSSTHRQNLVVFLFTEVVSFGIQQPLKMLDEPCQAIKK